MKASVFPPTPRPFLSGILFCVATFLTAVLAPPADATILYDLNTTDTSGGGQNTYGASTGSTGGQGGTFSGTLPDNLVFTSGGTTSGDYFIGKFSSQTLTNIGDTLTLSFTVTTNNFSQTGSQSIRFGFFDIGSATTGASSTFSAASGYRVDYGVASALNGIRERTGTADHLFSTPSAPIIGTQTSSNFSFIPANLTTYSGSFELELLAGGEIQITSQIGGSTSASITGTAGAFTSFNAFSFYQLNNSNTGNSASVNFSSLVVEYTAIPEPTGYAFLLAGLCLVTLSRRPFRR